MDNPFTEIGREYDKWYEEPLGAFVEEEERRLLLDVLVPRRGEIIADIGAGTGRLAGHLAREAGVSVIAVEPATSMREIGRRRDRGLAVEWHEGAAESLPIEDASVDAALLVTVVEFLPRPERAVVEARRVLRPGGRLLVGALSKLSSWGALYRHLGDTGVEPWASARLRTRATLADLLGIAPLSIRGALYLSPGAEQPFEQANDAGRRAGNEPAFLVGRWDKE